MPRFPPRQSIAGNSRNQRMRLGGSCVRIATDGHPRKTYMQFAKIFLGTALAAGFAALPLSSASAAYPCNPITGVFGAAATVAGAAVTIGTAPLVILSGNQPHFVDYTCGYHHAGYNEPYRYYHPDVTYDGPPAGAYGPPAAPPPAYYGRPHRPRWYYRHR